jgi:hypothetical protein
MLVTEYNISVGQEERVQGIHRTAWLLQLVAIFCILEQLPRQSRFLQFLKIKNVYEEARHGGTHL